MHHDLCFGCGQANLFGLLLEADRAEPGTVSARWFVKQDHQGPLRGAAHPGIVACALLEAIMLAADGQELSGAKLEFEPNAAVAVGSFCQVEAAINAAGDSVEASAAVDGRPVARLTAVLKPDRLG